ncbi:hypothetical protein HRI_004438500 [Hibiscus trionum]|uniref:Uncharacterized protein n=1 Tax=Hibiscus trionum TaxID=183268 RepID=A0A9W7J7D4_HIBTR|nr:hypothetical protein HRI_004438500 [Hibiscus trionum]
MADDPLFAQGQRSYQIGFIKPSSVEVEFSAGHLRSPGLKRRRVAGKSFPEENQLSIFIHFSRRSYSLQVYCNIPKPEDNILLQHQWL